MEGVVGLYGYICVDNWGRCLWKGFEDYIMMYFDYNWGKGFGEDNCVPDFMHSRP